MMVRYLSVVMVIFYITFGAIVMFTDFFAAIPASTRTIFGILLMGYGAFRLYRVFLQR